MVSTPVIQVIAWITTHLPIPEGWKAELAWFGDHIGYLTHEEITCQPQIRYRSEKVRQPKTDALTTAATGRHWTEPKPYRHVGGILERGLKWETPKIPVPICMHVDSVQAYTRKLTTLHCCNIPCSIPPTWRQRAKWEWRHHQPEAPERILKWGDRF